jgi:anti-anti-sigma factor
MTDRPDCRTTDLFLAIDLQVASVRVAGELDRVCAHHLVDAVAALAATGSRVWTLDLRGVTYCDLEGLRALHRARELARSRGRVLRLIHVPGLVAALLPIVGPHGRAELAAAGRPVRGMRAAV